MLVLCPRGCSSSCRAQAFEGRHLVQEIRLELHDLLVRLQLLLDLGLLRSGPPQVASARHGRSKSAPPRRPRSPPSTSTSSPHPRLPLPPRDAKQSVYYTACAMAATSRRRDPNPRADPSELGRPHHHRIHAAGAPPAPHRPALDRRQPRRPPLLMTRTRAVLQPVGRLSSRAWESAADTTPSKTAGWADKPRTASSNTRLPLLRGEPKPHVARPLNTTLLHHRATGVTPPLPIAARRVSAMTTLTDFQSGPIPPNPLPCLKPWGEKSK